MKTLLTRWTRVLPGVLLLGILAACGGAAPAVPSASVPAASSVQPTTQAAQPSAPAASADATDTPVESTSAVPADASASGGSSPAASGGQCFTETSQCLSGRFGEFWAQNGGLPVFGFPITPPVEEISRDTGAKYLTQWMQRNRFEAHPENQAPYDVLLGRLGDDRLQQQGRNWQQEPRESGQKPDCLWFDQTGHNVCNQAGSQGFRTYWETHGLEFDGQPGTSYAESLALFGLPLTEPKMETNSSGDNVLTQWFERARFEWHPDQPDQFKVLLGLLGTEVRFKWR